MPHTKKDMLQTKKDMPHTKKAVLMLASVASMIDQFNMPNIRLLQEMGYEVHTACNFLEGNTCDARRLKKLKETLDAAGVVWHQWDCPRDIASIKKCWKAYMQLLRLFEKYAFAWIHCHSPIGGALARMAAGPRGIRVIYTAHGFHFYRGAPLRSWLLYYPAEKLLAHWTDVLLTVNREDYRLARRRLKAGAVYHIPGVGIDVERFSVPEQCGQPKRKDARFLKEFDLPKDAVVLLSVGELNRGKNHRVVLAALAELAKTPALDAGDVYYLICGQGPLRDELLLESDRLGIRRYVRMPGYQEDMAWIYQNADIFVFPSLREGMPVALLEAMAAGLPCVVSDIRGNRELIGRTERFSKKRLEKKRLEICRGIAWMQKCFGKRNLPETLECPEELTDILKRMLADDGYRQACGSLNREHVKKYALAAVRKRMKRIYEREEACACGCQETDEND